MRAVLLAAVLLSSPAQAFAGDRLPDEWDRVREAPGTNGKIERFHAHDRNGNRTTTIECLDRSPDCAVFDSRTLLPMDKLSRAFVDRVWKDGR